jgi:hypothetical protein
VDIKSRVLKLAVVVEELRQENETERENENENGASLRQSLIVSCCN